MIPEKYRFPLSPEIQEYIPSHCVDNDGQYVDLQKMQRVSGLSKEFYTRLINVLIERSIQIDVDVFNAMVLSHMQEKPNVRKMVDTVALQQSRPIAWRKAVQKIRPYPEWIDPQTYWQKAEHRGGMLNARWLHEIQQEEKPFLRQYALLLELRILLEKGIQLDRSKYVWQQYFARNTPAVLMDIYQENPKDLEAFVEYYKQYPLFNCQIEPYIAQYPIAAAQYLHYMMEKTPSIERKAINDPRPKLSAANVHTYMYSPVLNTENAFSGIAEKSTSEILDFIDTKTKNFLPARRALLMDTIAAMSEQNWQKEKANLRDVLENIPIYTYVTGQRWIMQYKERIAYLCTSKNFATCLITSLLYEHGKRLAKNNMPQRNKDLATHDESIWFQLAPGAYEMFYHQGDEIGAIAKTAQHLGIDLTSDMIQKMIKKQEHLQNIGRIGLEDVFLMDFAENVNITTKSRTISTLQAEDLNWET